MLVSNWRRIIKQAWSIRFMVLALLCIIIEPIYTFVAATWVVKNIYIQLAMSAITGLRLAADGETRVCATNFLNASSQTAQPFSSS
ncbi:hypothetical protein FHS25_001532 [Rhizobium laguerreae]|uniref:Uncharacterized protein n=1 Tax=Rhizobium laguerreae TaxID=1076926 RepID=A0ABR6G481_9HYPH|nr:hypothetical protein [Rhizobium laguerreae]MBB3161083.1 hypothetical protein [Rhizobium laguerreae]OOO51948.1 hypothetical protein BS630_06075 [Rhizobium laguerreae]